MLSAAPKLQVSIHDEVLGNRQDRMDYLRRNAGVPFAELKLEEPANFKRKLKELSAGSGTSACDIARDRPKRRRSK